MKYSFNIKSLATQFLLKLYGYYASYYDGFEANCIQSSGHGNLTSFHRNHRDFISVLKGHIMNARIVIPNA